MFSVFSINHLSARGPCNLCTKVFLCVWKKRYQGIRGKRTHIFHKALVFKALLDTITNDWHYLRWGEQASLLDLMVLPFQSWGDSCHSHTKSHIATISPELSLCRKTNSKLESFGLINSIILGLHINMKLPGTIPKTPWIPSFSFWNWCFSGFLFGSHLPRALCASKWSQSLAFSDLQIGLLSETISTLPKNLGPSIECLVINFINLIKHNRRVSKSVLAGTWRLSQMPLGNQWLWLCACNWR